MKRIKQLWSEYWMVPVFTAFGMLFVFIAQTVTAWALFHK